MEAVEIVAEEMQGAATAYTRAVLTPPARLQQQPAPLEAHSTPAREKPPRSLTVAQAASASRAVTQAERVTQARGSAPSAAAAAPSAAAAAPSAAAAAAAFAVGDRVLVPAEMWPDFACTENGGAGWSASVRGLSSR